MVPKTLTTDTAQRTIDEEVVFKAMTRIREINSNAMARQGLLVDDYSKERLAEIENSLLIGFDVVASTRETQFQAAPDGLGIELDTSQSPAAHKQVAGSAPVVSGIAQSLPSDDGDTSGAPPDTIEETWNWDDR